MMRLDRWVSEYTDMSRKEARRCIQRGKVRVDGEVVRQTDVRIAEQSVTIDGVTPRSTPPLFVAWHKPFGVLSSTSDPRGRPSLATDAGDLLEWGLHPVGRLDADTDGLLLFSRDGQLTQRLLHPKRAVVRTYIAQVENPPEPDLKARLAAGIKTSAGVVMADLKHADGQTLKVSVTEGKHRMVRRILANSGHPVQTLRRLSYGAIELGDLEPGVWRLPSEEELAWAKDLLRGS
jgi:23S rRNA pseudouridine2605 synthase